MSERRFDRRELLGGMLATSAFVVVARMAPGGEALAQAVSPAGGVDGLPFHPSVYLGIAADGAVVIVAHRSEMGTGIRTSLPMVAADELDADWSRVRIEQATGDRRYGDQNTDGSRSVRDFYQSLRVAGATARTMLVAAAAAEWGVPAAECTTGGHAVRHAASGRTAGYGSLVAAAARQGVPEPASLRFKTRAEWRYVGKQHPAYDLEDIVTGRARFGADVVRPGMLFASIEHPPVLGGTVRRLDDAEALKVRGVQRTAALPTVAAPVVFKPLGGVAVIGDSTWAVFQGRKKLAVEWNDGPHASFESDAFRKSLLATVAQPATAVRNRGDAYAELARASRVVEATYTTPLLAHAAMEPLVAVAEVKGDRAEVWAPTQNPQAVQETVAQAIGIDKANVTCHVTLLGGGFGRKSKPDYCAEAAVLAKQLGRPVKVVWTREDDTRFDYYHSTAAVYHKAALDARGRPTAWLQRSVFPPIGSTFEAGAREASPMELQLGFTDLPFDVPNIRAENGGADAHVRIGWFRAVANNYHAFAAHSFADELAHAASRDPLEYLLDLLGPGQVIDLAKDGANYENYGAPLDRFPVDTRRLRRVLEIAGEKSSWAARPRGRGRGMGIAAHRSFNSYVASVVEVEVDGKGRVRIPRVVQVADAGTIVNPDRVRAQFEGAAVMAAGIVLSGEITAAAGRIRQGNFHDFAVPRMNDAPVHTEVHLVESDAPPSGVGEPGLPPAVAALANAIFAATGKRVRDLPLSRYPLA